MTVLRGLTAFLLSLHAVAHLVLFDADAHGTRHRFDNRTVIADSTGPIDLGQGKG